MSSNQPISLYFHIPFCTKKCSYCHFYVLPDKDPFKKQLMQGFKEEWNHWLPEIQGKEIASIYFGGGTPALMGAEAIGEILGWIKAKKEIEITLEANPENVTYDLMKDYFSVGINRVSIGIQTFDDGLLKKLGRTHDAAKGIGSVQAAFDAGIENISIDLMYDLPLQTVKEWDKTLTLAQKLPIKHLSLYNLTIEPHTVFFKYRNEIGKQLPDEEASLEMYKMAIERLDECGLKQYEISAFAKDDAYSRHNVGYWTARPFLGLGPSAFSYWNGRRFRNVAHLKKYCEALENGESPIDFEEQLSVEASRRELFVIELRLLQGVDLRSFQEKHGILEETTMKCLSELRKNGFLDIDNHIIRLSEKGKLFYDSIASDLI